MISPTRPPEDGVDRVAQRGPPGPDAEILDPIIEHDVSCGRKQNFVLSVDSRRVEKGTGARQRPGAMGKTG
jgi:hypothetical protein